VRAPNICRKRRTGTSTFCDEMVTNIKAAHHLLWRNLFASMHAAQTSASKLRLVTPEKESSMNTLWQQEEFLPVKRKSEGDRFRVVQERGY